MNRRLAGIALASLLGFASTGSAEEVKGTVRRVDSKANTLTLTVSGKDTTYKVGKDATFISVSTMVGKKNKTTESVTTIDSGLAGVKTGATVTVLTESVDDKPVVTSVKVGGSNSSGTGSSTTPPKKKKKKTN